MQTSACSYFQLSIFLNFEIKILCFPIRNMLCFDYFLIIYCVRLYSVCSYSFRLTSSSPMEYMLQKNKFYIIEKASTVPEDSASASRFHISNVSKNFIFLKCQVSKSKKSKKPKFKYKHLHAPISNCRYFLISKSRSYVFQ